jgi:nitroreductase
VELTAAVARRRMVRSFRPDPLPAAELDEVLDLARRAPAAGNTAGLSWLVLDSAPDVARYWDATLPPERRAGFRWQGLLRAPALVVLVTDPSAYVARYAEPDKARTGLGDDAAAWTVPYWWVDAGMAAQNLLLLATDRGWGACLFGLFHHEPSVRRTFGIPDGLRTVATVALGHPDGGDGPGRSAGRRRPGLDSVVHRGGWSHPS